MHDRFKQYGPIESIEVNNNCDDNLFGYVQFVESKNAHAAFTDRNQPMNGLYSIAPADTWHQPKLQMVNENAEPMEIDKEKSMTLDQLIEDCLIKIFKFCDQESLVNLAEVCQLFNGILYREIFPKHKELQFDLHPYSKDWKCCCCDIAQDAFMNLALMRRYLRCFGPYSTTVEFSFCYGNNTKLTNIRRIFKKFAQLIGPNLKELRIMMLVLQEYHLNELKPLLGQLQSLKICTGYQDPCEDIDFRSFCPDLQKLSFSGDMEFVRCAQPWPSLKSLTNCSNECMEIETADLLLKNNPQLSHLAISTYDCDDLVQSIARNSKRLEKLTLYDRRDYNEDGDLGTISHRTLAHLLHLKHLHSLKLMFLGDARIVDGILECLPKMTSLQKLRLHCENDDDPKTHMNHRLVVDLAKKLVNLKVFHIAYVHLEQDTIKDIIRWAKKLEEFHIYCCDFEFNADIIQDIVNVRKNNSQRTPLPKPLLFIVDEDQENLGVSLF